MSNTKETLFESKRDLEIEKVPLLDDASIKAIGQEAIKQADVMTAERYPDVWKNSYAYIIMSSEKLSPNRYDTKESFSIVPFDKFNPEAKEGELQYELSDYMSYIFQMLVEAGHSMETYKRTLERDGWQQEIRELIDNFSQTDQGRQLFDKLEIESLDTLSPRQAANLTVEFVRQNSKYSFDMLSHNSESYADKKDAIELLRDGMDNRTNPDWQGNGICRNIACNVLATFEALKETQDPKTTKLRNTYCFYASGDENSFQRQRKNYHSITYSDGTRIGHAWNQFVDLDRSGNSVVSIADATWGLDGESVDYSLERTTDLVVNMVLESNSREFALDGAAKYFAKVAESAQKGTDKRSRLESVALEDYLSLCKSVMQDGDESKRLKIEEIEIPQQMYAIAYQHADELDLSEIELLSQFKRINGEESLMTDIIKKYYEKSPVGGFLLSHHLTYQSDDFAREIMRAIGKDEVIKESERNGLVRSTIRRLYPDWLPRFDVTRKEDSNELMKLAERNGVRQWKTERIYESCHKELDRLCRDAPSELKELVLLGLSDYDLVANFKEITGKIYKVKAFYKRSQGS